MTCISPGDINGGRNPLFSLKGSATLGSERATLSIPFIVKSLGQMLHIRYRTTCQRQSKQILNYSSEVNLRASSDHFDRYSINNKLAGRKVADIYTHTL